MIEHDAQGPDATRKSDRKFQYNYGWECSFFTLRRPYHGGGLLHCWAAVPAAKQARSSTISDQPHVAVNGMGFWALYERC